MKKRTIRISVLSIVFSVMFLVVSSGAKAETQEGAKKDPASVTHLEAANLLDHEINPLRTLSVPLNEGLNAFLDLTSPPHPGLLPKESRTDYRAVIGFHFRLR